VPPLIRFIPNLLTYSVPLFLKATVRPNPKETSSPAASFWSERKVLGWPKICKLARAFLREYSYKRLQLAQLLGRHGVFLTLDAAGPSSVSSTSRRRILADAPAPISEAYGTGPVSTA
jgi:hypothetical protein